MKQFTLLFTAIILSLTVFAQVPQGINYQTVVRDGDGNILPDAEISLQMTIRSGAPDGEVVYQETHDATTNAFGLVNLVIGGGTPQNGTFTEINWGDGDKYLETAVDPEGGNNYTILGVTQFLSVPYAFESNRSKSLILTDENGNEYEIGVDTLGNLSATIVEIEWECGDVLLDNRDGQSYETVKIGTQCWMAENLNIGERIDGSEEMTDNSTIEKYCYGDDPVNCETYGGLYQWNEMMQYTTTVGVQGICPVGWHIPTDNEWKILEGIVDSQYPVGDPEWDEMGWRGFDVGLHLKSTEGWYNNGNGMDSFDFNAVPGGYIYSGNFYFSQSDAHYYTSTSEQYAFFRTLYSGSNMSWREAGEKSTGRSIRCLSDDATPPTTYNLILVTEPSEAGTLEGAGQYEEGEEVSVTANENSGWEFVNWTDANGVVSEVANFTYTMPAEDFTLTANFVEEQTGFNCGDSFTDSRDGQSYETVQIGEQCWMAENLNIGERIDGSEAMTDNGTIEKYCYDDDPANCETYGGLYQWNEMMQYTTTAGVQGICPEGWHLPTDVEWITLTDYVSSQPEYNCDGNTDYIAKALATTTNWFSYTGTCAVGNNPSANNSTGFSGLPGGYLNSSGSFSGMSAYGNWWTSTGSSSFNVYRYINYAEPYVTDFGAYEGLSIGLRCVRD